MNKRERTAAGGMRLAVSAFMILLSSCSSAPNSTTPGIGTISGANPAALIYDLSSTSLNGVVNIYPASATGTVSPTTTLKLPAGSFPGSIATDASGQIYVGVQGLAGNVVYVYPAGSSGTAAPSRTFTVASAPFKIAVDASGDVYTGGFAADGTPRVFVYPASANGSTLPIHTLVPPSVIQDVTALTTDSSGNLYVAGEGSYGSGDIYVYPYGADGTAAPSRTIQSDGFTFGMTVDAAGYLYTTGGTTQTHEVFQFSPSATGRATPVATISVRAVASATVVPEEGNVTHDAAGNIYFITGDVSSSSIYYEVMVYTFAPGVTSTSTPARSFRTFSSDAPVLAVH